jgi:hypothetical protein
MVFPRRDSPDGLPLPDSSAPSALPAAHDRGAPPPTRCRSTSPTPASSTTDESPQTLILTSAPALIHRSDAPPHSLDSAITFFSISTAIVPPTPSPSPSTPNLTRRRLSHGRMMKMKKDTKQNVSGPGHHGSGKRVAQPVAWKILPFLERIRKAVLLSGLLVDSISCSTA